MISINPQTTHSKSRSKQQNRTKVVLLNIEAQTSFVHRLLVVVATFNQPYPLQTDQPQLVHTATSGRRLGTKKQKKKTLSGSTSK